MSARVETRRAASHARRSSIRSRRSCSFATATATIDVADLLRALGYAGDDAPIRAGLTAAPGTELVVLFDLPASREELREAAGAAKRAIALIQPRQLSSLRALAAGGAVKPLTLAESSARARDRDARMRAELRGAARATGTSDASCIALEPLLDDFDGIEIAAAALQLLEREQANARPRRTRRHASPAAAPRTRSAGPMVASVRERRRARWCASGRPRRRDRESGGRHERGRRQGRRARVALDRRGVAGDVADARDRARDRTQRSADAGRVVRRDEAAVRSVRRRRERRGGPSRDVDRASPTTRPRASARTADSLGSTAADTPRAVRVPGREDRE